MQLVVPSWFVKFDRSANSVSAKHNKILYASHALLGWLCERNRFSGQSFKSQTRGKTRMFNNTVHPFPSGCAPLNYTCDKTRKAAFSACECHAICIRGSRKGKFDMAFTGPGGIVKYILVNVAVCVCACKVIAQMGPWNGTEDRSLKDFVGAFSLEEFFPNVCYDYDTWFMKSYTFLFIWHEILYLLYNENARYSIIIEKRNK